MKLSRTDFAAAVRRDWRWYVLAWAFPLLWLVGITAERAGWSPELFWPVWMPLFFLALGLASVPRFRGDVSLGESIILGMPVPFLIWAFGVFVRIALLTAVGRANLI